ncbi:hypothetical protein HK099_006415 [Clydaea vesicula]|uniref:Uncharacterized protein n=1 Tax=Clydaea vesicula TaxID=447962 RepID=A0AAD5XY93_9FUNG|nr:hypothetical protein HK099_006415 [Clydaea vesicula]
MSSIDQVLSTTIDLIHLKNTKNIMVSTDINNLNSKIAKEIDYYNRKIEKLKTEKEKIELDGGTVLNDLDKLILTLNDLIKIKPKVLAEKKKELLNKEPKNKNNVLKNKGDKYEAENENGYKENFYYNLSNKSIYIKEISQEEFNTLPLTLSKYNFHFSKLTNLIGKMGLERVNNGVRKLTKGLVRFQRCLEELKEDEDGRKVYQGSAVYAEEGAFYVRKEDLLGKCQK